VTTAIGHRYHDFAEISISGLISHAFQRGLQHQVPDRQADT
jgi:hypothetical protein